MRWTECESEERRLPVEYCLDQVRSGQFRLAWKNRAEMLRQNRRNAREETLLFVIHDITIYYAFIHYLELGYKRNAAITS